MTVSTLGIAGFGAYVPRQRISREEIAAAHAWSTPALKSFASSERSSAGYDEDSVTMAVEAARDCLEGVDRSLIDSVIFGSTTAPFQDRLNAGIIAGALNLSESIRALDTSGSQRAGTSSALAAFDAVGARGVTALCIAADRRSAPAGTSQEMVTGHASAAILVGPSPGLARLIGSASQTIDFVDHFRETGNEFDYFWEERWVREEGYYKLIPELVARALANADLKPEQIDHFCLPIVVSRVDSVVANLLGFEKESIRANLLAGCGDTGSAHPLLMLVNALETAKPGERILVVGFGQGGDALIFEATEAITEYQLRGHGVTKWLSRRAPLSYHKYLALNGLVKIAPGMRAEVDKPTSQTAAYRHRDFLLGLVGGVCTECQTRQIPRTSICVNPDCGKFDTQEPAEFAEVNGSIVSWSADNLAYTPDPPSRYGLIDFAGGGRLMMDITDVPEAGIAVGDSMRMVFRVKNHDTQRGFTRYFWKASPESPEGIR